MELDRQSRPQVVDLARRNPHGQGLQDRIDGAAALVGVGGRSVGHALNERLGGDHLDVRPPRKQRSEVLRQLCAEVGELLRADRAVEHDEHGLGVTKRRLDVHALLLRHPTQKFVEAEPLGRRRGAQVWGDGVRERGGEVSGLPCVDPGRQRLKRRLDRALCLIPADPGRLRDGRDELVLGDRAIDVSCHIGSAAAGSQLTSGGSGCGAIDVM